MFFRGMRLLPPRAGMIASLIELLEPEGLSSEFPMYCNDSLNRLKALKIFHYLINKTRHLEYGL